MSVLKNAWVPPNFILFICLTNYYALLNILIELNIGKK